MRDDRENTVPLETVPALRDSTQAKRMALELQTVRSETEATGLCCRLNDVHGRRDHED